MSTLAHTLSPRELEVLRLLPDGVTNKEAAAILGIKDRAVDFHAYNAYKKLGVGSRVAAIKKAEKLGALA